MVIQIANGRVDEGKRRKQNDMEPFQASVTSLVLKAGDGHSQS